MGQLLLFNWDSLPRPWHSNSDVDSKLRTLTLLWNRFVALSNLICHWCCMLHIEINKLRNLLLTQSACHFNPKQEVVFKLPWVKSFSRRSIWAHDMGFRPLVRPHHSLQSNGFQSYMTTSNGHQCLLPYPSSRFSSSRLLPLSSRLLPLCH